MLKSAIKSVAIAAAALGMASTAQASIILDTAGQSFRVNYTALTDGGSSADVSAYQVFTLDSVSNGGTTYTLSYSLDNTSTVSARLPSFGFDVLNGSLDSITGTGLFSRTKMNATFPVGAGKLDACFGDAGNGANCVSGGGGLLAGTGGTGTIVLDFSTAVDKIELDNFTTRFQSIAPSIGGFDSGIGLGTAVPEPATWAMLILGLGAIGGTLRFSRRRYRGDVNFILVK